MKKTLFILIVTALLGVLAAAVAPSSQQTTTAATISNKTATPSTSTSTTSSPTADATSSSQYKDGSYDGTTSSNRFDEIKVAVVVSGGKITTIRTPTLYGDSGRSDSINSYAVPKLTQQALTTQSASIDGVSGASYTTAAYVNSLQSALDQAKA
ncbi:MAG: FMN-binding protein [Candidatus Saccharibacteria bacterium]